MSNASSILHTSRFICATSFVLALGLPLACLGQESNRTTQEQTSLESERPEAAEAGLFHGKKISFRKQVQPLLANRCLACHGPDENAREADLRLDTEAGAKDWVIEVGDPNGSELITRIESDDPETVMPPPGHGDPLNPAEKKLLRDWIQQGATWQGHWAFEAIASPELPTDPSGWCKGPIDQFVLNRMKSEGLDLSPRADDRILIRRVYLDLIGLPPTPDQVEAFVNDPAEDRFETVVDELLK